VWWLSSIGVTSTKIWLLASVPSRKPEDRAALIDTLRAFVDDAAMIERQADVVVVGAGIVGCATAYYLARRGLRVTVVERAAVAGERSRKNWGFVRQQGRDPLECRS
jgi:NADPH-dependent 2,4-dienoyl-CoA reductase/sulfur reductase-like enzyme